MRSTEQASDWTKHGIDQPAAAVSKGTRFPCTEDHLREQYNFSVAARYLTSTTEDIVSLNTPLRDWNMGEKAVCIHFFLTFCKPMCLSGLSWDSGGKVFLPAGKETQGVMIKHNNSTGAQHISDTASQTNRSHPNRVFITSTTAPTHHNTRVLLEPLFHFMFHTSSSPRKRNIHSKTENPCIDKHEFVCWLKR